MEIGANLHPIKLKKLPDHLNYLGLLLYEYEGAARRVLKPSQWQLCQEISNITNITDWLKTGIFPSILESEKIIKDLGEGRIGTDIKKILDEVIPPEGNDSLEIIIKWDDDSKKPGSVIFIMGKNETENIQRIRIK